MWIPYVLFRELYLQAIRDQVAQNDPSANWALCHPDGDRVIPTLPGC